MDELKKLTSFRESKWYKIHRVPSQGIDVSVTVLERKLPWSQAIPETVTGQLWRERYPDLSGSQAMTEAGVWLGMVYPQDIAILLFSKRETLLLNAASSPFEEDSQQRCPFLLSLALGVTFLCFTLPLAIGCYFFHSSPWQRNLSAKVLLHTGGTRSSPKTFLWKRFT